MEALCRVLLIDDDVLLTEILSKILERAGYTVSVVNEPAEAVSVAVAFCPDIILLDYTFPGANGAEILAELRRTPGLESTRTAFLSGGREAVAHLDEHTWFIAKPCMMSGVLDSVRYILGSSPTHADTVKELVA
jgi:OmpR-family two-component system manganese-sensing response regulator